MGLIINIDRDPTPAAEPVLASGAPLPGHWMMGLRWPLAIWWRCAMCHGIVPIVPEDIDENGIIYDPAHSVRNEAGTLCKWKMPLRLLDYDADEHRRAVETANKEIGDS